MSSKSGKKTQPRPRGMPVFPPGVGKPALRALASVGITRLSQITRFTEARLMTLHGMGPKAMGVIKAALRAEGKSLKPDAPLRKRSGTTSAARTL